MTHDDFASLDRMIENFINLLLRQKRRAFERYFEDGLQDQWLAGQRTYGAELGVRELRRRIVYELQPVPADGTGRLRDAVARNPELARWDPSTSEDVPGLSPRRAPTRSDEIAAADAERQSYIHARRRRA